MPPLMFKKWLLYEMADFGFDDNPSSRVKGGTDQEPGEELFKALDGAGIIVELARLPALGANKPCLKWHDLVEWGSGPGAFRAAVTTLGSLKIVIRRQTKDLQGETTWICKHVEALNDATDQEKEIGIAHNTHKILTEMSHQMLEGPAHEFEDFERLAWKLWAALKRDYPSYCMFPVGFRKQDENYYKMVFEFRGQGVGNANNARNRVEQFDVDLFWDARKGLIRCWGYNIESTTARRKWEIAPSEWDEYFSPAQKYQEIIECVSRIFLQY